MFVSTLNSEMKIGITVTKVIMNYGFFSFYRKISYEDPVDS